MADGTTATTESAAATTGATGTDAATTQQTQTTDATKTTTTESQQTTQKTDATATIATGVADTTKTIAAPADFPADWRAKLAGDDKAYLKTLERFASPQDFAKAHRELTAKMSSGALKDVKALSPPENATPEQMTAWRKEQGLPEKAADYVTNLKLADGVVPGEADKPLLEAVAEMAHKANYPQKTVNDFVGIYYQLQDQLNAERQDADNDQRIEAQQTLISSMGADFKVNMNALTGFWNTQPEGLKDTILTARTADGRIVGNMPEVVSFFANLSRELNPAATLLPAGTGQGPEAIASRKAEIEKQMYIQGKPNPAYFGGPLEKEYRDLLEAEIKLQSRAA